MCGIQISIIHEIGCVNRENGKQIYRVWVDSLIFKMKEKRNAVTACYLSILNNNQTFAQFYHQKMKIFR